MGWASGPGDRKGLTEPLPETSSFISGTSTRLLRPVGCLVGAFACLGQLPGVAGSYVWLHALPGIPVGTALAGGPRTDPSVRDYRTGLLPWVRTSNRSLG